MCRSRQNISSSPSSILVRCGFLASWIVIALALSASRLSTTCGAAPSCENNNAHSQICQLIWGIQKAFSTDSKTATCPKPAAEESTQEKKKRKNPLTRVLSRFRRRKASATANTHDLEKLYPTAFPSVESKLSSSKNKLVQDLSLAARERIPDFESRSSRVPWSGPGGKNSWKWWGSQQGKQTLVAYLRIMKWSKGETKFPFSLCKDGCGKEFAIAHTLEFREKYKPWCISPALKKENRKGFVYARGYSTTLNDKSKNMGGHALVWLHGGIHSAEDPIQWIRAFINALDRAVGDNLYRTGGKVGKFNTVIDGTGFSVGQIPKFHFVKNLVKIMQDHFPDRLGVILLINFSRPAQLILGLIKKIISKEVREKLIVVPDDEEKRRELLEGLIEKEFIPRSLGGTDDYEFDDKEYYDKTVSCTNAETTDYLKTMPYHA
mmetsp:Transcript_3221/g.4883  ORF Transcript_3221/g.4883 Transcript_3221/m.4883 type:complete len:435 (+) Transcript_3221:96-1400(+)